MKSTRKNISLSLSHKSRHKSSLQKIQKAEKTVQRGKFVVMGHNRIKGTKFYGPWVSGIQEARKCDREAYRKMLECTPGLKELFSELAEPTNETTSNKGTKEKHKGILKKGNTELAMLRDEKKKRKQLE